MVVIKHKNKKIWTELLVVVVPGEVLVISWSEWADGLLGWWLIYRGLLVQVMCVLLFYAVIFWCWVICANIKRKHPTDFNSVRSVLLLVGVVLVVLLLLVVVVVVVTKIEINRILSDRGWDVTALIDSCVYCETDGGNKMGILIYFGFDSFASLVLRCVGCEINGRIETMKLSYFRMSHHCQ